MTNEAKIVKKRRNGVAVEAEGFEYVLVIVVLRG